MATYLKNITPDQKRIFNKTDVSNVFTMAFGSDLTFTKLDSVNNPNFKTNKYNSLWSMFNLNSQKIFNSYNVDYSEGGMIGTLWQSILEAYNTNGMVMFEVNEQNFRKSINGQNIEVKIPLTGATSATTLYSALIDTESLRVMSTKSVCDPQIIDTIYSEGNKVFTNDFGIGYTYQVGSNPIVRNDSVISSNKTQPYVYDSGMVFLMSNDWSPWSGSSTAKTWSDGYNVVNKYTHNVAPLITPNGINHDVAAGAFFINSGLGYIWAEDFVNSFNWSGGTGGTGTTEVTFAPSEAYVNAADIDTTTFLQIDITMEPKDFNTSINQSYIEESINNGSNCDVAYNTITLNDASGKCLVIAKSSEPVVKPDGGFSIVTIDIPIDGDIGTSLDSSVGCLYGSCL